MMKKILSFLIVLGAITFINIDLFASSYDDPVNNQEITIDTPLVLLNNNSLRDVFETYVILPYNIISIYSSYITDLNNSMITETNMNSVANQVATQVYFSDPEITNSLLYLVVHTETSYLPVYSYTQFYPDGAGIQTQYNDVNSLNIFQSMKTDVADDDFDVRFRVRNEFDTYYADSIVIKKQFKLYALNYFGIENLSQSELDYHYQLYRILSLGFSPTVYYDQGYDNGYDDGNLFGYNDGYTDGINEGYINGLAEYHFGRDYGSFSYESGIPYLSGFDNGYNAGEQTGYNEGLDYAATNNLTLLSIFELIIGVVINMLTFIITIEVFGISILSLLSTAALLVGVVWILKLVRG